MTKSGFSLIEIIMVILVVGILSVVAVASFSSSLSVSKFEAAKFRIKSDIIYAQSLAVTQQLNHGVVFDPALETYSVYRENTGNIVNNPLTGLAFTVNFNTDQELNGVNLVSTSFGAPTTNIIEFDSMGRPSDGASALVADGNVTISYSGLNGVITVVKNTGMVN